jgi:hypothetical protein
MHVHHVRFSSEAPDVSPDTRRAKAGKPGAGHCPTSPEQLNVDSWNAQRGATVPTSQQGHVMPKLGKGLRLPNSNGYWAAIRAVGAHERYYLQDAQSQPPQLSQ